MERSLFAAALAVLASCGSADQDLMQQSSASKTTSSQPVTRTTARGTTAYLDERLASETTAQVAADGTIVTSCDDRTGEVR